MEKISNVQIGQMMKAAAASIRSLSEEKQSLISEKEELSQKVAHFEKKERCEKLASMMESKNLQPEMSYAEKVASLMNRDNLDVIEEAIGMQATQSKTASVHDSVSVLDGESATSADVQFMASLAE